ncbi:MAG TPA: type I glutamate--ammonia ligase [Chloroflexus aurantiacus]|jgi:glutamine synthetase|uniref:Glutamine synthetase n=1 Tax=Chloroflexus aurantiacus (strain ATCC 29366 / DSM 635 / J-10-fl) TaxID=324602 RepID=A9WJW4_CHLAA|nr:type I glutamate--ammonia ligase [Chloroflexus aurantiacus]RMG46954.1 MAG: type I glutamate--ammonia ligase [Chloroflexota bacterium]GIV94556.1 MAG: glutamine synthetase [Chloroflexus sp.]ABY36580.1 glutamine synthetase, type I [Chloroflexus aurantiacus J-10-fl]GIV95170.1 MAG: glutamine synthetase [Chloroflexus sp.]HBW66026.1 type I glutamate--ammonia ligase [Chloroflexus aurantiacus]
MSDDPRTALLHRVEADQVAFINLQFTDVLGIGKTVTIPVEELPDALDHGVWFDGSSIEGFARMVESDMYLVPDISTYAVVPWDQHQGVTTARLICSVYTPDGKPFAGDPRNVLRRMLDQAAAAGYRFMVAPELEFFLFKTDPNGNILEPHDKASYFDISTDLATHIRRQMARTLQAMGIAVEAVHHEVAPGQHEIDLRYADALQSADHLVTARVALKAVAQMNGLHATFMPKPIAGVNGSGMHVHQSLLDRDTGKNLFADPDDPYGLSALARHFIAGLLAHARGMCALLAPLVNSYKRLVPGFEAPVYISWGRTNRSALVRVPRITAGRYQATRIELRCPDPACNPYLAYTAMLAAGLDGIRRKLPLRDATEEDLFHVDPRARGLTTLPTSLGSALDALREDEVILEAIGPSIAERFLDARQQEWESYRAYVSQWEIERYLAIF